MGEAYVFGHLNRVMALTLGEKVGVWLLPRIILVALFYGTRQSMEIGILFCKL